LHLQDTADDNAVGKHVEVVVVPLADDRLEDALENQ
jgi:hypothetical protein